MQTWGPFHDPSLPLPFLVTSPRPRPLPLPPPKATTITSVAASFASTTYNQKVPLLTNYYRDI